MELSLARTACSKGAIDGWLLAFAARPALGPFCARPVVAGTGGADGCALVWTAAPSGACAGRQTVSAVVAPELSSTASAGACRAGGALAFEGHGALWASLARAFGVEPWAPSGRSAGSAAAFAVAGGAGWELGAGITAGSCGAPRLPAPTPSAAACAVLPSPPDRGFFFFLAFFSCEEGGGGVSAEPFWGLDTSAALRFRDGFGEAEACGSAASSSASAASAAASIAASLAASASWIRLAMGALDEKSSSTSSSACHSGTESLGAWLASSALGSPAPSCLLSEAKATAAGAAGAGVACTASESA
mmetsp:Transcript_15808/g.53224  ORF Transcript_15808/g.53224 Transcript_15808/m.53224 type:complete len:304 (+) Transcript_15808:621-1532(+)